MGPSKTSLRQKFPKRVDIPLLLITASGLLFTGLSLPLLKVQQMIFWKSDYSIMRGIISLAQHGDYVLSALIFFFSIVFPVIKLLLLGFIWLARLADEERRLILIWLGILGKWSMLDVFVVAIIIVLVKIGPLAKAEAQSGVYFFTAAIVLSLMASMAIERLASKALKNTS